MALVVEARQIASTRPPPDQPGEASSGSDAVGRG
jgi:hypothetical protein